MMRLSTMHQEQMFSQCSNNYFLFECKPISKPHIRQGKHCFLVTDKEEKILSGEADVAHPICPITRIIYRERHYQQTLEGRVISLSEIRKRHPTQMQNMGLQLWSMHIFIHEPRNSSRQSICL